MRGGGGGGGGGGVPDCMYVVKRGVSLHYFYIKNTKTIYLLLKALRCPCGTILPRTGNFAVNACTEDNLRLQS